MAWIFGIGIDFGDCGFFADDCVLFKFVSSLDSIGQSFWLGLDVFPSTSFPNASRILFVCSIIVSCACWNRVWEFWTTCCDTDFSWHSQKSKHWESFKFKILVSSDQPFAMFVFQFGIIFPPRCAIFLATRHCSFLFFLHPHLKPDLISQFFVNCCFGDTKIWCLGKFFLQRKRISFKTETSCCVTLKEFCNPYVKNKETTVCWWRVKAKLSGFPNKNT